MSDSEMDRLPEASLEIVNWLSDPVQTLKDIAARHEDGYLQAFNNEVVWRIYFRNGKLQYASGSFQSLATLDYHFRCVGITNFTTANQSLAETGLMIRSEDWLQPGSRNPIITWFHRHGYLNVIEFTQLLENLTKEAVESFLWLTEGHYQWTKGQASTSEETILEPRLELGDLISHFQDRMQQWQKFDNLIKSPHQRPYLFSQGSKDTSSPELIKLSKLLRGMSIRQLALMLNQDEIKIANLLYPFIKRGEVYLHDPQEVYRKLPSIPHTPLRLIQEEAATKVFKIACVDDSPTILNEMQRFLNHDEYEVTKIDDPVKAASVLFRLKPDLILMDITMPEINGYKLCSLLRNSVALRETPIVMVTGRSGIIDKARAKVTGATDYLVKPFTRGSLLAVVEKYLH